MSRTRPSAATVAAIILVDAGCGGGGGDRLGRDAYAERADALCREAVKELRQLPTPTAIADIPGYVDAALPILDDARKKLHKLRPPQDLDARVNAWLEALDTARDVLRDLGRAARDEDGKGVAEFGAKASENDRRARSLARAMGLVGCANA